MLFFLMKHKLVNSIVKLKLYANVRKSSTESTKIVVQFSFIYLSVKSFGQRKHEAAPPSSYAKLNSWSSSMWKPLKKSKVNELSLVIALADKGERGGHWTGLKPRDPPQRGAYKKQKHFYISKKLCPCVGATRLLRDGSEEPTKFGETYNVWEIYKV